MKTKFQITTRTVIVLDDSNFDTHNEMRAKAMFEAHRIQNMIPESNIITVEMQKDELFIEVIPQICGCDNLGEDIKKYVLKSN